MIRNGLVHEQAAVGQGCQSGAEVTVVAPSAHDEQRNARGQGRKVHRRISDGGVRLAHGESEVVQDRDEAPSADAALDLRLRSGPQSVKIDVEALEARV